jgi:hypothetical protein
MVGYGATGTGATGDVTFDGLKRAGQNMIDAVAITPGKENRILLSDFDSGLASDNSYGSAVPHALEAMIAPGDSGGGLFIPCGSAGYADDCLAGITSFGWGRLDGDPNSDFGDVGGFHAGVLLRFLDQRHYRRIVIRRRRQRRRSQAARRERIRRDEYRGRRARTCHAFGVWDRSCGRSLPPPPQNESRLIPA